MKLEWNLPDYVLYILNTLQSGGFEGYIVGGCVRDICLGRTPHDWDITTSATPQDIHRLFPHTADTGVAHGTVTVLTHGEMCEVTTYRIDGEYLDGRHPKEVAFTSNLKEDLKRRDFTMNAMAYNPQDGLVDLFEGRKDLERGLIRCVGDPEERFEEDALRMLRAVRFAAQLSFSIEDQTQRAIRKLAPALERISAERICMELEKLLVSPNPSYLRLAWQLGMTKVFLPEFDRSMEQEQNNEHHFATVGEHTLLTMEAIAPERILRFVMLLHDIGKPGCVWTDENGIYHFSGHAKKSAVLAEDILRRLKFDNASRNRIVRLVACHSLYPENSDEGVRKAVHIIGPDCFADFLRVKRADIYGQSENVRKRKFDYLDEVARRYEKICERGDCLQLKDLCLGGKDLLDAGFEPGKGIGTILEALLDDVLETPEHNNRKYLLDKAEEIRNMI